MFDIDKLKNNPLYNVSIVGGIRITNAIYVDDTFQVEGQNMYEDSWEQMYQGIRSRAGLSEGGIADAAQKITGNYMKLKFTTIPSWVGSNKPNFTLNLLYTSTEGDSPVSVLDELIYATYPEERGIIYTPPLQFNSYDGGNALCSIRIGRWFEAHNQLITGFQAQLSKEVWRTSQSPAYMMYTVNFTPFMLPTAQEFSSYFR